MDRPYKKIRVADAGATRTITLAYPERRNAIGTQMINELLYALGDAMAEASVRVCILAAEGKVFCAGGDFAQMTAGSAEDVLPIRGDFTDLLLALWNAEKPIVARVQGSAMGGGLGLVASSTFAILADDAHLGTPEINVGLFPMMIMAPLARLVPRRKLLEMMLFGEKISATQALEYGLVNRVVPSVNLDEAVAERVEALLAKSPAAMRLGLAAYAEQGDLALRESLPLLRAKLGECLSTDDAREGLMAFMEKRPARWTGK